MSRKVGISAGAQFKQIHSLPLAFDRHALRKTRGRMKGYDPRYGAAAHH
jgi:hypothetical protein